MSLSIVGRSGHRMLFLQRWGVGILLILLGLALAFVPKAEALSDPKRGTLDGAALDCSGRPETHCDPSFSVACSGRASRSRAHLAIGAPRSAGIVRQVALNGTQASASRANFDVKPLWASSGVWSRDGSLLLADVVRGGLLRYSIAGSFLGTTTDNRLLQLRSPSALRPLGDKLMVRDGGGRFLLLDDQQRMVREWLPLGKKNSQGEIRAIFQWAPLGESILAFGDLLRLDGTWESALFRIPLAAPQDFEVLKTLSPTDQSRRLYLLGNPYIATLGSKGYFFSAADFTLYEVDVHERSLRRVSRLQGYSAASLLPAPNGSQGLVAQYAALEKGSLSEGIYARGGNLFVLFRRPGLESGGSQWFLARVDLRRGSLGGEVLLPTNAKHLTLVPGPHCWALLEKGVVLGPGHQDIPSMILVPSAWAEGARPAAPAWDSVEQPLGRIAMFAHQLIHRGLLLGFVL
jgi:hypothetical protein